MPRVLKTILACMAATITFDPSSSAEPTGKAICEREIIRAAELHSVPISILYAIGLNESGRKGEMTPHALNIAGKSSFPASLDEGLKQIASSQLKGIKLIDVGCMQINIYYHSKKFKNLESMFDARMNVEYAANFIRTLKQQTGTWTRAVARYHAGPGNQIAQKRYVCAVIRHMVSAGVGEWTPAARSACST